MDIIQSFYDNLATQYDKLFLDWQATLEEQSFLLDKLFQDNGYDKKAKVLDCACGIGTQAIGLAGLGYHVTASDISDGELDEARKRALKNEVKICFQNADFRALSKTFPQKFDIVIAMDNALPHMLSKGDLELAIESISSRVATGGMFVASIRNYDDLLKNKPPYSAPYIHKMENGQRVWKTYETLYVDGEDFVDIGKVTFEKEEMQKVYGDKSFTVKPTNNTKNVTYTSSNKKAATVTKSGKVTIKGCGKTYIAIKTPANGKKKATYKKVILGVCPQKVNLLSAVLQEKNRVKITWEKSKNAKGYCVEYSTDKDFKKSIKWYEEGIETVSSEFSVKSGQTYYIRVCACGESRYLYDDMYNYDLLGEYSEVKNVKVK